MGVKTGRRKPEMINSGDIVRMGKRGGPAVLKIG